MDKGTQTGFKVHDAAQFGPGDGLGALSEETGRGGISAWPDHSCRRAGRGGRLHLASSLVSVLKYSCVAVSASVPVSASGIRVDCNVYLPAIGIGATAALIGSMMANAENSAVASVRSSSSASESPSAEILRICSSLIV